MPDHAHLLVEAKTDSSNALRFISRSKQFSGFHYQQRHGQRLWQRYGYERVLREDEDTRRVARYIVNNLLRRGLVANAKDYPFVGSCVFSLDELLEGTTSG